MSDCGTRCPRLEAAGLHPEALDPCAAGRYRLEVLILALMRKVVGVGGRCHGFKADEVATLGSVDDRNGELRSVNHGDLLILPLHPELGIPISAAGECGKAIVKD